MKKMNINELWKSARKIYLYYSLLVSALHKFKFCIFHIIFFVFGFLCVCFVIHALATALHSTVWCWFWHFYILAMFKLVFVYFSTIL